MTKRKINSAKGSFPPLCSNKSRDEFSSRLYLSNYIMLCYNQNMGSKKKINIKKSPLKEAYILLDAKDPGGLDTKYREKDQILMKSVSWDYKSPTLLIHKIKDILEHAEISGLSADEKYWRLHILWSWYHHAISCAVWRYHDQAKAQVFAKQALIYQPENHPNKITRLLYFLVHDKLAEAETWQKGITTEPEKTTAIRLMEEYKINGLF